MLANSALRRTLPTVAQNPWKSGVDCSVQFMRIIFDSINMPKIDSRLLIFTTAISIAITTMASANDRYQNYCNSRFEYCLDYPTHLKPQPEAQNGDGRDFTAADGSVNLKVWGSLDISEGKSPAQRLKDSLTTASNNRRITYRNIQPQGYVLSGYTPKGKIFYRKTILKNGELVNLEFTYPTTAKKQYDAIVTHVARSFQ